MTTANQPPSLESWAGLLADVAGVAGLLISVFSGDFHILGIVLCMLAVGYGVRVKLTTKPISKGQLWSGIAAIVVGCIGLGVIGDQQVLARYYEKAGDGALSKIAGI